MSAVNPARWASLLTFAGVGLKINFSEMKKQGLRPFVVGAPGEVAIAAITIGLVLGASKLVKIQLCARRKQAHDLKVSMFVALPGYFEVFAVALAPAGAASDW